MVRQLCLGVPSPHELTPFCLKQTINPNDVGALNLILLEILSRGHMETIWGLDLGTTSIGFSVIRMNIKKEHGEIIKTGVRIFPEGLNNDHEPRNKRRRDMRLHRRQLRRRRIRRVELSRKFEEIGLLPEFATESWNQLMDRDPYALRNRGLREQIELHEFGGAICHLVQRRGNPAYLVMKQVGHKSDAMLRRYQLIDERDFFEFRFSSEPPKLSETS